MVTYNTWYTEEDTTSNTGLLSGGLSQNTNNVYYYKGGDDIDEMFMLSSDSIRLYIDVSFGNIYEYEDIHFLTTSITVKLFDSTNSQVGNDYDITAVVGSYSEDEGMYINRDKIFFFEENVYNFLIEQTGTVVINFSTLEEDYSITIPCMGN